MKRLCALLGFICFFVLMAVFYFGEHFMWLVLLISGILLIVSLIIPKTRREKTLPVAAITAILSCLWLTSYSAFFIAPVQERFNEKEGEIIATQKALMYYDKGYYCHEVEINSLNGEAVNANALIMSEEPFYSSLYDEIHFKCKLYAERRGSFLGRGIVFTGYVFDTSAVQVYSPENKPILYYISEININLETALYKELDVDTANFSTALLLGNRYKMENDVTTLFRNCGISHVVVVSGLHLSIITALISKLLRRFIKNRAVISVCIIIAVLTFAALTGFGYSVLRAAVVQIVIALGGMFRRKADSLNSLGIAALIIILPNPYASADVGFQLSLLSTLGIVTLSDRMYIPAMEKLSAFKVCRLKPVNLIFKVMLTTFFTSLSASLATLPITVAVFGGVSTVGVFVNILIVPLITPALILAAICAVGHYVGFLSVIVDICAFLLESIYSFTIWVCKLFSMLPYSYIRTNAVYFTFWIGLTLILVGIAIAIGKRRAYVLTVLLSLLALTTSSAIYNITHEDTLTLRIPDTNGKTVILESLDSHCILTMDGSRGRVYRLLSEIEKLPPSEGNVAISFADKVQDIYLKNLITEFDYKTVLRYDMGDKDYTGTFENYEIIKFTEDYKISLWDKAELYIFMRDDYFYEYVKAEDSSVLILPQYGDALHIPEEFRNPKIIVTERLVLNMDLLSCDTLIVVGDEYMGKATAGIGGEIANKVVLGTEIVYDIN